MEEKDKQLIIKYLYGTCTPMERHRVQQLLERSSVQEFIRELSWKEWNHDLSESDHKEVFQVWKEKVNARIPSALNHAHKGNTPVRRSLNYRYAAVWAFVFLLAGLGVWQWQQATSHANITLVNDQGVPARYLLPDSSTIYLAAGSTISYPEQFAESTREISLNGEAFFDIKRNPNKAFIIHTNELSTKVLGTSFKIVSLIGRPLEVAVATGKVSVSRQEEELTTLTPGYKVIWDEETKRATREQTDIEALEKWKNGDFIFEKLEMVYISQEMEKRFGINIQFMDASIKSYKISGTFAAEKSAEQVMRTLAIAGNFRYERSNKTTFKIYKQNKSPKND